MFDTYDLDRDGKLDYKEFSGIVLGSQALNQQPKSPSKFRANANHMYPPTKTVNEVVKEIKQRLTARGGLSYLRLITYLQAADEDEDSMLSLEELEQALRDARLDLSPSDLELLFEYVQHPETHLAPFNALMVTIRGEIPPFRKSLVNQAYTRIGQSYSSITVEALKDDYACDLHPDVLVGKKTKESVLQDFIECLDLYKEIFIGDEEEDPVISADDFSDMYTYISAGVEDCKEFEAIIKNCWQLLEIEPPMRENGPFAQKMENTYGSKPQNPGPYSETYVNQMLPRSNASEKERWEVDTLITRIRGILTPRGPRGFAGLQQVLRAADPTNKAVISHRDFIKTLAGFKVNFTESETSNLLKELDQSGSGFVQYQALNQIINIIKRQKRKKYFKNDN